MNKCYSGHTKTNHRQHSAALLKILLPIHKVSSSPYIYPHTELLFLLPKMSLVFRTLTTLAHRFFRYICAVYQCICISILNVPQYYHYPKDNEKKLGSNEGLFILFISAILVLPQHKLKSSSIFHFPF